MDDFVSLHNHSEFSFLDGFGKPKDYAARAKELGQKAIAITDHGNVSAHKRWYDTCTSIGVKPILGLEAYVCDNATKRDERRRWHITLLAKNLTGYRNLLRLTTRSYEEGFFYKPRVDWDWLAECAEGVIATSGCPSGKIGRNIRDNGWGTKEVVAEMKRQAAIFQDYFVEISPWQFPEGVAIAQSVYKAARQEGLPMVLTIDAHYVRPEQAYIQDVMMAINQNKLFSDPNRLKFSQDDFCLWSGEEMQRKWTAIHGKRLPFVDDMILNTSRIADMVDFKFPSATPLSFKHPGDKVQLLAKLCADGMKLRGLSKKPGYAERLAYEFDLVVQKNFVDYFLVVNDLVAWAKDNGILVGAARGSSCGSLMCYVLRITEVDPIPYNLVFERFVSPERADVPDIDIDFESERRHEVKEYLERTYGADRVASLATYGTFKGKLCLQDIGRVFADKIPWAAVEETKRLIIQRSSADSRAGFTIEDTFTNFEQAAEHLKKYPELALAKELEGKVRHLGVHAAGVIIANEPIGNFAAIYTTPKKDRVISMDYDDVTSIGLLKIDILGLTALTAMKKILQSIKARDGVDIDLNKIEFEDAAVYENFCLGNLQGIFQFEGEATKQVCRQIQPRTFMDLSAVNALSRPGPAHCLHEDSLIRTIGGKVKLKRIFEGQKIFSWDGKRFVPNTVKYKINSGKQEVFEVVTEKGDKIKATKRHRFLTRQGWKRLEELSVGDWVMCSFKSHSQFKQMVRGGIVTRFAKGATPWNKGKKWKAMSDFCRANINSYTKTPEALAKIKATVLRTGFAARNLERIRLHNSTFFKSAKNRQKQSLIMKKYYKDNPHKHPNTMLGRSWMCSKPQRAMFETIKKFFPGALLNERVVVKDTAYYADVLVPGLKIVFEYDDIEYWHKNPSKDKKRDAKLRTLGFEVLRFNKFTLPLLEPSLQESTTIKNSVGFCKIMSIVPAGVVQTYDLCMANAKLPNFIADKFVVHNSGVTTSFIERRFGREKSVAPHPLIAGVLSKTHGLPIYQEQVMQIVRLMGLFDWKETAFVRKAMSKKLGDEAFGKMKEKFVASAGTQGVPKESAEKTWQEICTHGAWSFNCSHSVAYSVMAYQLMWLKTHYPIDFYVGVLSCEPDEDKQRRVFKEFLNGGFGAVLPVDINESGNTVLAKPKGLLLGLDSVVGLGEKQTETILAARPYKDFVDFQRRCRIPRAQSEKLLKLGAFRNMDFTSISAQPDLFGASEAKRDGFDYQNPDEAFVREFCPLASGSSAYRRWGAWVKKNVKGKLAPMATLDEISEKTEVMVAGFTDVKSRFHLKNKMEEALIRGQAWVAKEGEEKLTKEEYSFLNFDLEDDTDTIIVRVSYKLYPKFKELLWNIKPSDIVGVRGMMTGVMRMVFAHNVVNLTLLKARIEAKEKLTRLENEFLTGVRAHPNRMSVSNFRLVAEKRGTDGRRK